MRKFSQHLRALSGSLLSGALLQTSPAHSIEDPPLKLVWTAPRHCPQPPDVTAQIRKLVGSVQGPERIAPLSGRGVIEAHGDQFHLTLMIQDGATTGMRSIASTSCKSLGDAAAVVLSLLIRQRRELGRALSGAELSGGQDPATPAPPSSEPPPDEGANSAPPNPPIPPPPAAPRAATPGDVTRDEQTNSRRWRLLLAAPVMHLEYGTLPKLSAGVGLALGVVNPRWQFFASAALFAPQSLHVVGNRSYDARFLNRSAASWVCRTWNLPPFQFAPCVQLAMNLMGASTSAMDEIRSHSKTAAWLSVGGGLKTSLHINQWLGIFVRATGRLNLTRPDFLFVEEPASDNPTVQRIHRVSAGIVDLSFGGEWLF